MPLSFDLPFDKLLTYSGINPRPDDFDNYWDDALAEMRSLHPNIEFVPSDFQTPFAECLDLYFTGVGGARIHARVVRPRHDHGFHPAVLMFHGYSGDAGDWLRLLPYAALGYTVAALDCRGQGGFSQDTGGQTGMTWHGHIIRGLDGEPRDLLYRSIFLDTAQLAHLVMDMHHVDPTRVGVTGDSQGGGLTLACAALAPKIKLAAPVYPFLCDYKRVWELDLDINAYAELRDYFRWHDPLHQHENEIFTRLGYIDVQNLCPRIKAEVYMGVSLRDQICPPSTQFAAYNKITATKNLEIYPDFAHEKLHGHDDRIFQFLSKL